MDTIAEPIRWSLPQKIVFRFSLIFLLLYIFFNPNGVLPFADTFFNFYIPPFHNVAVWMGKHLLHLPKPITVFTNGSGDTTYDYVIMLLVFLSAFIGAIIWSVLDNKRTHYNKLFYWLSVVVRYYIAITMMSYGFVKVFKLQFPYPSAYRLIEPYGNSSPMGLAWTFIGQSAGYNYFTGFGEIACGLLLFFRKTATLGAILTLVVAANIMAINYCFDVPVKLLSTMLVIMSIYLLSKDLSRLIDFFFLNKLVAPADLTPHRFSKKWKNVTLTVIKVVIIVYVVFSDFSSAAGGESYTLKSEKSLPLAGLYNVKSFVKNTDTLQPLTTDTTRWNKLIIEANYGCVKKMNDSTKWYIFKTDTVKKQIRISTYADTLHKYAFSYSLSKQGVLVLNGKWKKDSLNITLNKYDLNNFLLRKRGFHWVNEYPLNK